MVLKIVCFILYLYTKNTNQTINTNVILSNYFRNFDVKKTIKKKDLADLSLICIVD